VRHKTNEDNIKNKVSLFLLTLVL